MIDYVTGDEAEVFGLRAVAAPGWTWDASMRLGEWSDHVVLELDEQDGSLLMVNTGDPSRWEMSEDHRLGRGAFADCGPAWPELRDPATFAMAYAQWQKREGHEYVVPCPVLTAVAAHGISSRQAIEALVSALEAAT